MRNKKGFTLIELLVVIAIIGLLSTLAVVSLNGARAKARDAKRLSDMKGISSALEMFSTEGGTYLGASSLSTNPITTANAVIFDTLNNITVGGQVALTADDYKDPTTTAQNTECDKDALTTACGYTLAHISANAYEVCFYLEGGSGSLSAGVNKIVNGGAVSGGCTAN